MRTNSAHSSSTIPSLPPHFTRCYPLMPRQSQISRFNRSRHSLGHRLISSSSSRLPRCVRAGATLFVVVVVVVVTRRGPSFPGGTIDQRRQKKGGLFSVNEREPTGQSRDQGVQGETRSTHWMGCDVCLAACKSARALFILRLTPTTS